MKTIQLTEISAFELAIIQGVGDMYDKRIVVGYLQDGILAKAAAKGANKGSYTEDGSVVAVTLYTDGETLYKLEAIKINEEPVKFMDADVKYRQELLERIKSKLSTEELELLKIS